MLKVVSEEQPFLCLRRGVSQCMDKVKSHVDFSLPTQRCFFTVVQLIVVQSLFSAYAEVFLEWQLIAFWM